MVDGGRKASWIAATTPKAFGGRRFRMCPVPWKSSVAASLCRSSPKSVGSRCCFVSSFFIHPSAFGQWGNNTPLTGSKSPVAVARARAARIKSAASRFAGPARRQRADDQQPVFPHRRILERHHRRANARRAAAHDYLQLSTLNRDHLMALFGNELYFAAELRLEHGELDKHRVVDNDQRHDRKRYHQSVNGEFVFPA